MYNNTGIILYEVPRERPFWRIIHKSGTPMYIYNIKLLEQLGFKKFILLASKESIRNLSYFIHSDFFNNRWIGVFPQSKNSTPTSLLAQDIPSLAVNFNFDRLISFPLHVYIRYPTLDSDILYKPLLVHGIKYRKEFDDIYPLFSYSQLTKKIKDSGLTSKANFLGVYSIERKVLLDLIQLIQRKDSLIDNFKKFSSKEDVHAYINDDIIPTDVVNLEDIRFWTNVIDSEYTKIE